MTRRRALAMLAAADPEPEIRLLLGGDVMLARGVLKAAKDRNDWSWPLRAIAPTFREADIAFANLEGPFGEDGKQSRAEMVFRVPPEMVAGLATAGIHVVSTANNHARDAGAKGVEFTVKHLRAHNIDPVGTGLTEAEAHSGVVLTRKGIRFGFLGYTWDANNGNYTDVDPRIAMLDAGRMRTDMERIRQKCDVVIVSMHGGWEYFTKANPFQIAFAKAAIDAGATVVAGHHPHVVQQWERYKDGVIYYSLGNLVFDQSTPQGTKKGILADVRFRGAKLAGADTIPIEIVGGAPRPYFLH